MKQTKPLTQRKEAFVHAFLKLGIGAEAYRLAYPSSLRWKAEAVHVNASKMLADPAVRSRLQELQDAAAEEAKLTKAWVLERLMRNARIALGEEKIKLAVKPKGEEKVVEVEVHDRDPGAANRALELLGKELKMFIDRSETGKPGEFDGMSLDQLRELAAAEAAALGFTYEDDQTERGDRAPRRKPH